MSNHPQDTDSPITVFARHSVIPGKEEEFERWMAGIAEASSRYTGYLGTEVISPSVHTPSDYVVIFRFNNYCNLERWIESEERQSWIDRVGPFSAKPPTLDYHSLEFWFSPDKHGGHAPSKYKMALTTFAIILPLVHFIPSALGKVLGPRPLLVEASAVALIVLLMTYALMPAVTRLLQPWLFGRAEGRKA
jgi:antibiotic biosynthesis monooxygenase (ABM) superfamily enzyme